MNVYGALASGLSRVPELVLKYLRFATNNSEFAHHANGQ